MYTLVIIITITQRLVMLVWFGLLPLFSLLFALNYKIVCEIYGGCYGVFFIYSRSIVSKNRFLIINSLNN